MTETPKKKCEKCGGKGLVSHEPRQMTAPDGTKTADPLDNQQWDLCAPCGGAGVVPDIPAGRKPAVQGGGSIVDTFNKTAAFDPILEAITLEEIDRALDCGLSLDSRYLISQPQPRVGDIVKIALPWYTTETVWALSPPVDEAIKRHVLELLKRQLTESMRHCLEYSTTARANRPGRRADEETIWNFGTTFAGKA